MPAGQLTISGVDTRTLTRRLREHGTMQGWLLPGDLPEHEAKALLGEALAIRQQKRLVLRSKAPGA